MAENEPIPVDLELPEHFSLPEFSTLTPDQQDSITSGPGWVSEHVDVVQFDDADSFRPHIGVPGNEQGCGNFVGLLSQEGIFNFIAEHTPAVQRYLILFPDQAEALRKQVSGVSDLSHTSDTLQQARRAYKIIAELIDSSDDYVSGNPDEDKYYLTR